MFDLDDPNNLLEPTEAFPSDMSFEDLVTDAQEQQQASFADNMGALTAYVNRMVELENDLIPEAEDKLSTLKEELRQLVERAIPDLMKGIGVQSLTLENGQVLNVNPVTRTSLPKEDLVSREIAFKWLEENGHGGVIKHTVGVYLSPEDAGRVEEVKKAIASLGLEPTVNKDVHAATLKAVISRAIDAHEKDEGPAVPEKPFGVYRTMQASLKSPKSPKAKKSKKS